MEFANYIAKYAWMKPRVKFVIKDISFWELNASINVPYTQMIV